MGKIYEVEHEGERATVTVTAETEGDLGSKVKDALAGAGLSVQETDGGEGGDAEPAA